MAPLPFYHEHELFYFMRMNYTSNKEKLPVSNFKFPLALTPAFMIWRLWEKVPGIRNDWITVKQVRMRKENKQ